MRLSVTGRLMDLTPLCAAIAPLAEPVSRPFGTILRGQA